MQIGLESLTEIGTKWQQPNQHRSRSYLQHLHHWLKENEAETDLD